MNKSSSSTTMAIINVVLRIVCFQLLVHQTVGQCPSACTCKWKSGKQTAECFDQGLITIPSGINSDTQVIDLSRNNFQILPSRVFMERGLVNLQKIYLFSSKLGEVSSDAFYQLTNLVELDMSNNLLTRVPVALRDCPLLRRLQLSNNPIRRIGNDTFAEIRRLTSLELSRCQIDHIETGAFVHLKNLEYLKLDGNRLTTLSPGVMQSLPPLYSLELHDNPWMCDCGLRDVKAWIMRQKLPLGISPRCSDPPRAAGIEWALLGLDDFACPPEVVSTDVEYFAYIGENVTLTCRVRAVPRAMVFWEMGGYMLRNQTVLVTGALKYYVREEADDIQFSSLSIIGVGEEDGGVYKCVAENVAGVAASNFTLVTAVPPPQQSGLSKMQLSALMVGLFVAVVIAVVAICIVLLRRRALGSVDAKLSGVNFLKHLALKRQELVEMDAVKAEKNTGDLAASLGKPPRQETGSSSGYGSDQQTPDLVSKGMELNGTIGTPTRSAVGPQDDGYPIGDQWTRPGPSWPQNQCGLPCTDEPHPAAYHRYCDYESYNGESPLHMSYYPPHYPSETMYNEDSERSSRTLLRGPYDTPPSDTASFRDECYCSYTSPAHTSWKRSPLVLPNAAQLSLPSEARYSPDEGYAEETLEGTEV